MGYLKYKGYTGSVEYSEDDKCLLERCKECLRIALRMRVQL